MNLEEVIKIMKNKPYLLNMGKGTLSKRLHCSSNIILEAKRICRTESKNTTNSTEPKILLFDVETAPMRAFVWRRWKQNISLDQTISEWFMICWSAKWLNSEEVFSGTLTSKEILEENDYRIVKKLWDLINEADIVIAYNGKHADIKWMNTRFIIHNMPPTKPYFVVDPCDVAKKSFGFSSNKLDALAGYFNIDHKIKTDFQLWKDCLDGREEALNYMEEYNKLDVIILEKVYLKMRPWIVGHPNLANIKSSSRPICSYCGSENLEELDNHYYTNVGKYNLYRCKDCNGLSRSRKSLNKNIKLISVGK